MNYKLIIYSVLVLICLGCSTNEDEPNSTFLTNSTESRQINSEGYNSDKIVNHLKELSKNQEYIKLLNSLTPIFDESETPQENWIKNIKNSSEIFASTLGGNEQDINLLHAIHISARAHTYLASNSNSYNSGFPNPFDWIYTWWSWGYYSWTVPGERTCSTTSCCEQALCEWANCRDQALADIIWNGSVTAASATLVAILGAATGVGIPSTVATINRILSAGGVAIDGFNAYLQCSIKWMEDARKCAMDNEDCECNESPRTIYYPDFTGPGGWDFPC